MRFRPMEATEEDVERLGVLFDDNEQPKERAMLRWRYLENPEQPGFADFAITDEGQTGGVYCVSPYRFRVGSEVRVGVQSLDTLVDVGSRGQGLFTRLANTTYQRCSDAGVGLVYGFPNGSSAPGFFRKLGWTRLDPVPFLIRPLRPGYFARRLLGERAPAWLNRLTLPQRTPRVPAGCGIRVSSGFTEQHTALWHRFAGDATVGIERDAAFLRWRFQAPYRGGYLVHECVQEGRIRGYVVSRVAKKHGGVVGYVMELICEDKRFARALLDHAVRELAESGAEVALAWSLPHSPLHRVYSWAGFLPFPTRLRPIELHFGARAFDPELAPRVGNRQAWYLSYADSDTV